MGDHGTIVQESRGESGFQDGYTPLAERNNHIFRAEAKHARNPRQYVAQLVWQSVKMTDRAMSELIAFGSLVHTKDYRFHSTGRQNRRSDREAARRDNPQSSLGL
jgi:hypothetical protein